VEWGCLNGVSDLGSCSSIVEYFRLSWVLLEHLRSHVYRRWRIRSILLPQPCTLHTGFSLIVRSLVSSPTDQKNMGLSVFTRIPGLVDKKDFGGVGMRFIGRMHMQWYIC